MPAVEVLVELVGRSPTRLVLSGALQSRTYSVSLVLHSRTEVSWLASGSATSDAGFVLDIGLDPVLANDESCVEIRLADENGEDVPVEPRFLRPSDAVWPAADERVGSLREEREAFFNVPLVASPAPKSSVQFAGVVLVEGLLLTMNTRVPGIRVFSLKTTLEGSAATVDLLQSLLLELTGYTFDQPAPRSDTGLPLVALHAPSIHASTPAVALECLREHASVLVDILGANRRARPRLAAAAVGETGGDGRWVLWLDPRRTQYFGNLLGGFVSGESSTDLLMQWDKVATDPRLSLWFRQLADARDEPRWEYRILRYVNLLEGIVKSTLGEDVVVVDNAGSPRPLNTKDPYTTRQARGAIYMAIAGAARHRGDIGEDAHCRHETLWEMCMLWTVVRNQAAHAGAWESPLRVNAHEKVAEFLAGSGGNGRHDLESELADCVNFVIDAVVFRGYLPPPGP